MSSETVELVLQTAQSLGYVRDIRAAQLASNSTATLGLVIRGAEHSFYGQLAARVQAEADARGADLLIVSGADNHDTQARALESLIGHRVAGIIVASGRASIPAAENAAKFVPTLLLGLEPASRSGLDSVVIDPSSEALLARTVAEAGHRHVAVTVSDRPESTTLRTRAARFGAELAAHGVSVTVVHGAGEADPTFADNLRRTLDDGATAVMAGDDPTAVEILEHLLEWGLRCPDDVSVTGFDGVGVYHTPLFGLATIRQPVEVMAREAVRLMLARLKEPATPAEHLKFPGELLPGRTLGPPRTDNA